MQQNATKLITAVKDNSYEEHLKIFNMLSFHYRHCRRKMIQIYKILNGLVQILIDSLLTIAKNQMTFFFKRKLDEHCSYSWY